MVSLRGFVADDLVEPTTQREKLRMLPLMYISISKNCTQAKQYFFYPAFGKYKY